MSFRSCYLHSGSVDPKKPIGWKQDKKFGGGGVLFDLGSHVLDVIKGYSYICDAIGDLEIRNVCQRAMQESARTLSLEHGVALDNIMDNVNDLINRFDLF